MGLEEFGGQWGVMTSGRGDKLPAGQGKYLCIYADNLNDGWLLMTRNWKDAPVPLGNRQEDRGHENGGGMQRIYCTVTFDEGEYHFEAVLARQLSNGKPVIYGHLYPTFLSHAYEGEGAVGGWSADRQGDPPDQEQ